MANGNGGTNGNGGNSGNGHNGHTNGNGHKKVSVAKLTLLAHSLEEKRTAAKRLYSEADEIELKIINAIGVGGSFQIKGTGRTVLAKNNFVDSSGNAKTISFRPCGVKLCEVKIIGGARTVTVADDDE